MYIYQQAQSWGAVFFPKEWRRFLEYYNTLPADYNPKVPFNTFINDWNPRTSWKKYLIAYMYDQGRKWKHLLWRALYSTTPPWEGYFFRPSTSPGSGWPLSLLSRHSQTRYPPSVWIQLCYGLQESFGHNLMNLLDCMGQPAVAETVWPPRGLNFLAPLVLYSSVDHTNFRESNYPMELRCLM